MLRVELALELDFLPALNNLGAACRRQGDLVGSMGYVQRALDLNPSFAEAHSNCAAIFQEMVRLDDAIAELRIASRQPGRACGYDGVVSPCNLVTFASVC